MVYHRHLVLCQIVHPLLSPDLGPLFACVNSTEDIPSTHHLGPKQNGSSQVITALEWEYRKVKVMDQHMLVFLVKK